MTVHRIELHIGPGRGAIAAADVDAQQLGRREVITSFRCSVCDFFTCNPMGYIPREWFEHVLDHLKTHGEA
jgi:hypothetical protein